MGQKKLVRFAAIQNFANVLQYPENTAGRWADFFKNNNPVTLELACGKGEYSTGLGSLHANRNFIGIDIKGNRIYTGAKKALAEGLSNVAFMRTQIGRLAEYFAPGEVSEIWIVFADPFLKKESNRLTFPRFLRQYQQVLKPGGIIHLKTDSDVLYQYTLETISALGCAIHDNIPDIYKDGIPTGPLAIKTFYEAMHLADNRTIHYVSFSLPETEIVIPPKIKKTASNDAAAAPEQ